MDCERLCSSELIGMRDMARLEQSLRAKAKPREQIYPSQDINA
jgi:hypothetical protein